MPVKWLKVSKALHWLKLNHVDYYDCEISEKNLASYPEDGPPVVIDYYPSNTWWSGPLLRMACTSPVRFNWLLCNMP